MWCICIFQASTCLHSTRTFAVEWWSESVTSVSTFDFQWSSADPFLHSDILLAIQRVCRHIFVITNRMDIAFEVGRFLQEVRCFTPALQMYTTSMDSCGETAISWLNCALCHIGLHQLTEARLCLERALQLDSTLPAVHQWMHALQQQDLTFPDNSTSNS